METFGAGRYTPILMALPAPSFSPETMRSPQRVVDPQLEDLRTKALAEGRVISILPGTKLTAPQALGISLRGVIRRAPAELAIANPRISIKPMNRPSMDRGITIRPRIRPSMDRGITIRPRIRHRMMTAITGLTMRSKTRAMELTEKRIKIKERERREARTEPTKGARKGRGAAGQVRRETTKEKQATRESVLPTRKNRIRSGRKGRGRK